MVCSAHCLWDSWANVCSMCGSVAHLSGVCPMLVATGYPNDLLIIVKKQKQDGHVTGSAGLSRTIPWALYVVMEDREAGWPCDRINWAFQDHPLGTVCGNGRRGSRMAM